jgi:tetratricopeptide (TPR) repeat protein
MRPIMRILRQQVPSGGDKFVKLNSVDRKRQYESLLVTSKNKINNTIAELLGEARDEYAKKNVEKAKEVTLKAKDMLESELTDGSYLQHISYPSILNNLGLFHKELQDYEKAIEYQTESVQLYTDLYHADHPSTVTSMHNLATTMLNYGEKELKGVEKMTTVEQARIILKDTVEARRELVREVESFEMEGIDEKDKEYALRKVKNDLASSIKQYARSYEFRKKEAKKLYKEAISLFDEDPLNLAITYNDYGLFLKKNEEYKEAEDYYYKALDVLIPKLGKSHELSIITQHNLAELYEKTLDVDKANTIREDILKHNPVSNNE